MVLTRWENAVISKIALAIRVSKDGGRTIHSNRPFHGFVLNEADSDKNYIFSDGRVLHTKGNCFFYLPKESSYRVACITHGACYAINFDADLSDDPFAIDFRNAEPLFKLFKSAVSLFTSRAPFYEVEIRRILYEILLRAKEEKERRYIPEARERLLAPAIEHIREQFTQNDLTVRTLASLCDISEAYFRRLFADKYGSSPKEYVIKLRMELAKTLLSSGDFSVSETALQCGYAEPCHFSREFTRQVGISPKAYKDGKYAKKL